MGVLAGRDVTLYLGGTPTTMTGEACESVSSTVYRVTSATKRVIDPATAVTVYVGGVAAGDEYTIDYAAGLITFDEAPGGAVTVDAKYIPLYQWVECKSADITIPQDILADVTRLGDAAPRMTAVMRKCEMTVDHMTDATTTLGGAVTLQSLLDEDTVFVKAAISSTQAIVGWFEPSASYNHAIGAALEGSVNLTGRVRTCVGAARGEQALFSLYTV